MDFLTCNKYSNKYKYYQGDFLYLAEKQFTAIFLCGVLWGKMEECGEGKMEGKGAIFTPLLSSKIKGFCYFDTVSDTT